MFGYNQQMLSVPSTKDVLLTCTEDVHGMVEVLLYGPVHGPVLPLVRASTTSACALRRRFDVADFTSAVKRQSYPWKERVVLLPTTYEV